MDIEFNPSVNTDNFSSDFLKFNEIPFNTTYAEETITNTKHKDNVHETTIELNKDQIFNTVYEYNFGINSINIFNKQPLPVAGYISPEVTIKNSNFITLSVTQTNPDVSQEYSIIDNNKETAIQPKELPQVIKEKLFFNLPIRFDVDTSKEIIIYKNNIKTDLTYSQINTLDTKSDEYTITYTPKQNAFRYKPTSKTLKVKVIQRHLGSEIPSTIKTISIVCHGGSAIWNI